MTALPGTPESCWIADAPPTRYPRLTESIDAGGEHVMATIFFENSLS